MSITNLSSTNVNGILDLGTTQQNIGNGVNASATDEVLLFRAPVATQNTTGTVTLTNCAIKAGDVDVWLEYGTNTQTNSTITLRDCYVEWNIAAVRRNIRITSLIGTHIRATNTGGSAFIYTQAGNKAVIDAQDGKITVIDGVFVHEIAGAPLTYRNAAYKNCGLNILNWEAGNLPIRNIAYGSGTKSGTNYTGADGATYNTYDAWLGGGNSANKFRFYDCTINLSKIFIQTNYTSEMCFKYYSRSEKYLSGATFINGLQIQFSPTASSGTSAQSAFFVTTTAEGVTSIAKIDLLVQTTVNSGTTRSTGIVDIPTAQNYTLRTITWRRTVRGYGYQSLDDDVTPTSQVGDTSKEAQVYLLPRTVQPSISQSAAAALTGITLAASGATGGTITVTEPRTAAQLWAYYNNWITLQANRTSNDTWEFDGATLNIGAWDAAGAGPIDGNLLTTGTVTAVTTGAVVDSAGTRAKITDADGRLTSFHAWVYDAANTLVYDSAFQSQVESITVTVPTGGSVRVYSQPYGYISKITNASNVTGNLQINHVPETLIDTTLDTTIRNEIESHFSSVLESNIVYVEIDADLAQYTPAQALNGLHYFIVNRGFLFSASSLAINSVDSVKLIDGGFRVYSPGFRGRAKSTLNSTNTPSLFVTVPLYIEDSSGVPGNQVFVRNANGIAIVSALWTKATANITNNDINSIATRVDQSTVLAKEATVATRASQASVTALGEPAQATALTALATVNQAEHDATQQAIATLPVPLNSTQTQAAAAAALVAYDAVVPGDLANLATTANVTAAQAAIIAEIDAIPTNPLLTTDSRLNNLDAAISSRSTLTAPQVRTELTTELSRLDVAVGTRLAAASYVAPTTAPSAADNAAAVRTNLATELARIDVATSTRLASASYVAPTAAPTSAQNAAAVRTELAPELGRIDVAVSTRSTLTAGDIPAGLTAAQVWSNTTRTLTETAGLTPEQESTLNAIPTLQEIEASTVLAKDATVLTRLAANSYQVPPTPAAIRSEIERTGGMLDALPILLEIEASNVLAKQSGFVGLATSTNVSDAQVAIVSEINANETKINGILGDTAAIKAKTDTLVNGPTLANIEASTILAKEATVNTRATQASVNAIPTNPLLTTDTRLNNLDAAISTRSTLAVADIPAGLTAAEVWSNATRTLTGTAVLTPEQEATLNAIPTLQEIEASTVLAKDATVLTRLAANSYQVPPTPAAIRSEIEKTGGMLDALPILSEIEASNVLAKQSGFVGLATSTNVLDSQTAIVNEINSNETKINVVLVDTAAIKAKTDILVNTDLSAVAKSTEIVDLKTSTLKANVVQVTGITIGGNGTEETPWGPSV